MAHVVNLVTFPWISKCEFWCPCGCGYSILKFWRPSLSKLKMLVFRLRVLSCVWSEAYSVRRRNYDWGRICSCLIDRLLFSNHSCGWMFSWNRLSSSHLKVSLLKIWVLLSWVETNLCNICTFLAFSKCLHF